MKEDEKRWILGFVGRDLDKKWVSYDKFDEISVAFHIGLQVHEMKVVTSTDHDQVCTQRTKQYGDHRNFIKSNTTYLTYDCEWSKKKKSVPKLSKQTIQDSKQWLIQTIRINHCIEPQTGN